MPLLPQRSNTEENSEKLEDRTPLPDGKYVSHIVKTEFLKTKAGDGHRLSVHFRVLEGKYTGRAFFTSLNLDNPNPQTVEIANKEANSISEACGLTDVEDSDEWLQIPMLVGVKFVPADDDWPAKNETASYENLDQAQIPEDDDEEEEAEEEGDQEEEEDTEEEEEAESPPEPEARPKAKKKASKKKAATKKKLPWE